MSKRRKLKKVQPTVYQKLSKAIYIALILFLTFGLSTVGKAAQKIKRTFRTKKNSFKASYAARVSARSWAYFRPTWQPVKLHQLPAPVATERDFVSDPQNLIEDTFSVPVKLKGRVSFWVDVYSRFSSQYRIIHDKDNPEIIYGYIDLRPIYRAYPPRMADSRAYKVEQQILKDLKNRIQQSMEVTPRESVVTDAEKEDIKKMLSEYGITSKEQVGQMMKRVRTQTGQRDHFLQAIHRSKKLMPQIEMAFKERGLPLALARLPFVESSFHRGALSKTGALGIWQFMPDTSRLFDPSGSLQEWADPVRQTKSAARMFRVLDRKFNNWGIAVTAYNSGGGRLQRIKETFYVDKIEDIVALPSNRDTLGFAGKNFYSEFLAANIVDAYKTQIFPDRDLRIAGMRLSRRTQSILETMAPIVAPLKTFEVDSAKETALKSSRTKRRVSRVNRSKRRIPHAAVKKQTAKSTTSSRSTHVRAAHRSRAVVRR